MELVLGLGSMKLIFGDIYSYGFWRRRRCEDNIITIVLRRQLGGFGINAVFGRSGGEVVQKGLYRLSEGGYLGFSRLIISRGAKWI
ncbi:hypothetical protein WAI453_011741 [Rhynchosporium graminicola]